MKSWLVLLIFLQGCTSYNHVKIKAGLELPIPFFPIDFGITVELNDKIEEKTNEEILKILIDEYILDAIMRDSAGSGANDSGSQEGGSSSSGSSGESLPIGR